MNESRIALDFTCRKTWPKPQSIQVTAAPRAVPVNTRTPVSLTAHWMCPYGKCCCEYTRHTGHRYWHYRYWHCRYWLLAVLSLAGCQMCVLAVKSNFRVGAVCIRKISHSDLQSLSEANSCALRCFTHSALHVLICCTTPSVCSLSVQAIYNLLISHSSAPVLSVQLEVA